MIKEYAPLVNGQRGNKNTENACENTHVEDVFAKENALKENALKWKNPTGEWTAAQLWELYHVEGGVRYLVKDILPRGHITILYGWSGIGKSLLATHLAFSIARGDDCWLGLPITGDNRSVVILDAEMLGPVVMAERLCKMGYRPEYVPGDILYIEGGTYMKKKFNMKEFQKRMMEIRPGLIIIDSFQAMHGSDAQKEGAVTPVMQQLMTLADTTDAAVLLIDHVAKKDAQNEEATPYGSGYKRHYARSTLLLREYDVTTSGCYYELSQTKNNFGNGELWKATIRRTNDEVLDFVVGDEPDVGRRGAILRLLAGGVAMTIRQIYKQLQKEDDIEVSERTVRRDIALLVNQGKIRQGSGQGKEMVYYIPKGEV